MIKPHLRKRPWLPEKAIDFLEKILTKDSIVVETGSGSSTIYMARLAKKVISFEHKKVWFDFLEERIQTMGIKNIDLRLDVEYSINGIQDPGPFDFVLVDGRGRTKTVETIHESVRQGGWIALDNANRERYQPAHDILNKLGWKSYVIMDRIQPENKRGFTVFWQKP